MGLTTLYKMISKRSIYRICTLLLLISGLLSSLHGQSVWTNVFGGDFGNPANWDPTTPGAGVTATFGDDAAGTITATEDHSIGAWTINKTNITPLTFNFGEFTLAASGNLSIQGTSKVNITGGTFNYVIFAGSSTSATVISGVGTEMIGSGYWRLQNSASLTITDSASMVSNGSGGRITNNGTLLISAGGSLSIKGDDHRIGGAAGNASITVTGESSLLDFTDSGTTVRMGWNSSNNTMNILDGGKVQANGDFRIGNFNTGGDAPTGNTVLVSGTGSILDVDQLRFSANGSELRVEDGGKVIVDTTTRIGETATSSNNSIVVTGSGSQISFGTVVLFGVNTVSNTTLEISDGASVTVGTNFNVGDSTDSTNNRVSVLSNSSLSVGNTLELRTDARLEVYDSTVTAGSLQIQAGSSLVGNGILNTNVASLGGAGTRSVIVEDAEGGFGVMTVNGDWNNTNLTITLKIGDLTSGIATAGDNFDQLLVEDFTYGGALLIDISEYQGPTSGNVAFRLIGWDSAIGDYESLAISFSGETSTLGNLQILGDGLYITAIPEPETIASLFGLTLGAIVLWRRRIAC